MSKYLLIAALTPTYAMAVEPQITLLSWPIHEKPPFLCNKLTEGAGVEGMGALDSTCRCKSGIWWATGDHDAKKREYCKLPPLTETYQIPYHACRWINPYNDKSPVDFCGRPKDKK